MIRHETKIRVRYAETDQMGYVYYGNYAMYFEVARVEMIRSMGCSYKSMEDQGILMPVLELKTKYIKPAFYDQELTIKTVINTKPGVRIRFDYEVFDQEGQLLTVAETTLVFVSKKTGRPTVPIGDFADIINQCFLDV